jgi:2-iminoacetate synthase
VQPLSQEEYERLHEAGVFGVSVSRNLSKMYKSVSHKGKKSNFDFRLDTQTALVKQEFIGLGVLLGLEDWRTDSFFNALHLDYLKKTWQTKYRFISLGCVRLKERFLLILSWTTEI